MSSRQQKKFQKKKDRERVVRKKVLARRTKIRAEAAYIHRVDKEEKQANKVSTSSRQQSQELEQIMKKLEVFDKP